MSQQQQHIISPPRSFGDMALDLLSWAAAHCALVVAVLWSLPAGIVVLDTWPAVLLWTGFALMAIPWSQLLAVFLSAFFVECYRLWRRFTAHEHDLWDGARHIICMCWKIHGRIWHGFEVSGMENLPKGPAIIAFYHGASPIDQFYVLSEVLIDNGRLIKTVVDRSLFKIPGWKQMTDVLGAVPGGMDNCLSALRQGYLVAVSPGGMREAFFGEGYEMMWNGRVGFAKLAIQAKVPVIPMFTMNVRESYIAFMMGRPLLRWLYERLRLPIVFIYGGFPVKMRTYLGRPIYHEDGITPEQLAVKVRAGINQLIEEHQKLPGNIMRGLLERVIEKPKSKSA